MSIIEDLVNIVAPHHCVGCQAEGDLLCDGCAAALLRIEPRCYSCGRRSEQFRTCERCRRQSNLYGVWAFTAYDGVAKQLLHDVKFARAQAGAKTMGRLLASLYSADTAALVTHVPTATVRVRQRGYDQAALMARTFAGRAGLPFTTLLARMGTQRQLGQQRQIRKQQLEYAFRPLRQPVLKGRHILLVDDVLTTGASCEAAAWVLLDAGARRVSAIVFAVA